MNSTFYNKTNKFMNWIKLPHNVCVFLSTEIMTITQKCRFTTSYKMTKKWNKIIILFELCVKCLRFLLFFLFFSSIPFPQPRNSSCARGRWPRPASGGCHRGARPPAFKKTKIKKTIKKRKNNKKSQKHLQKNHKINTGTTFWSQSYQNVELTKKHDFCKMTFLHGSTKCHFEKIMFFCQLNFLIRLRSKCCSCIYFVIFL